jgi:hypothetical protein
MERQDIDDQLSTTGAKELLASTSAAHLAYIAKDANTTGDSSRLFLDGDQVVISSATYQRRSPDRRRMYLEEYLVDGR